MSFEIPEVYYEDIPDPHPVQNNSIELANGNIIDANIPIIYGRHCVVPSDIAHFMPLLRKLASECESVFETGVRDVVSTWAFAYGLCEGSTKNPRPPRILMNDIDVCDIRALSESCANSPIHLTARWCNNLDLEFQEGETYDITFIDTLHVYGQLKRELAKFAPITNKYIILHDVEVDGQLGEIHRLQSDPEKTAIEWSEKNHIPPEELLSGLMPAVTEFLEVSPEWKIKYHLRVQPGLMVLERVQ